ncbi:DUF4133 domain-containing protein [Pedobacter sp. KR3-3]|uniref:DUF4133 domain-containing protein n=1 Tax=Pedobacter albus TaxID=3113905 RepID=A0ABU7IAB0_9SPHI|nr:DUF4133 domain-containing protein [Pedobacter sp. KR3-3]MEE1946409.1 DUF4133 domain-containing protein [Pedobacter sp. KR3-3]
MSELIYEINKGVNRPVEFRGLKAQYIYVLALGLAALLVGFSVMYILGVPVYLCLPLVLLAGSLLFFTVYRYSHKYGEHGLMKALAWRQVPEAIIARSRKPFTDLRSKPLTSNQ